MKYRWYIAHIRGIYWPNKNLTTLAKTVIFSTLLNFVSFSIFLLKIHKYIYQYLPCRCHHERCPWWPDRAESFRKKLRLFKHPIFPQVAIKFILKDIKWCGWYNICSGKQFQLSHTPLEKANFPISKLNLLLYNFNEWRLLLSNAKVKKKLILIDTINVI